MIKMFPGETISINSGEGPVMVSFIYCTDATAISDSTTATFTATFPRRIPPSNKILGKSSKIHHDYFIEKHIRSPKKHRK